MKNIFTIPADVPFVDALATGIYGQAENDPLKLSAPLILLPTRRACLHLREAFRQHLHGASALLPRMQPIGDPDEQELYFISSINPDIPPAIAPLRRQMLLTQMIRKKDDKMPLDQASRLAEALASLLDEVQTEQRDLKNLQQLVAETELAEHWKQTVDFLEILTREWPLVLAGEKTLDPIDRRNRILKIQAETWKANPPDHPVIAAGSTGSVSATAYLLNIIADLPHGTVILPGLDQQLSEEAWQEIDETHPQYTMKEFLSRFEINRKDVKIWEGVSSPRPARIRLLQESMLPANVSETWRDLNTDAIPPASFEGIQRLELDHLQEEAQAVALLMRETLETPGKTAALVTPDRALAARVSALLKRWDIRVNDSAGTPLLSLPTGGFLVDALKAAAPHATPVDKLALLKHPFTACGLAPTECRARARQIEIHIWRTQEPKGADDETALWLEQFSHIWQPFTDSWRKSLPLIERIDTHIALAEQLASSNTEKGGERLWAGEEGEAATAWFDEWRKAATSFPPLTGAEYIELFTGLITNVAIRGGWGLHPRLSILGPLEARLIHTDRVILGGLNEGVWPPETPADPWMSRPMKKDFGLPLPEKRIGLSAHDFMQLASAGEVFLTRARRQEGAPSVPSRFLMQLDAVLRALGYSNTNHDALAQDKTWAEWARNMDAPNEITPCAKPEPRPAQEFRPRELSVTDIGTWRRNPYAIYARHILKLKKLDALQSDPDNSDRGEIIHKILEDFIRTWSQDLPPDALQELLKIGQKVFAVYAEYPEVQAFWWPRFEHIAAWFVEKEKERRNAGIMPLKTEAQGRMALNTFTLKGRADRIDRLPDGTVVISDYKTGFIPSDKTVAAGYEPQLPLLAVIAAKGGFDNIGTIKASELAYWKLNGGREGSEIKPVKDGTALAIEALEGLEQLIAAFDDPQMPYRAVPNPELQPRYNDYAHLARLQEWGRTEDEA